ncbi:MAG: hypothetical protein AAGI51_17285 [Pseudomonadota bacterium]
MLTTLITVVKLAAITSLLVLAYAAYRARKPDEAAALETRDIERHDPMGALVFKGFTAMLIVGASAMLLLTLSEVVAVL